MPLTSDRKRELIVQGALNFWACGDAVPDPEYEAEAEDGLSKEEIAFMSAESERCEALSEKLFDIILNSEAEELTNL